MKSNYVQIAFLVFLSGCQSFYHPKQGDNTATINVINQSALNLGMAVYEKPKTCEEPSWLIREKLLSPKKERSAQIDAGKLTTLLFTSGDISTSIGGVSVDGITVVTKKEWCYIAVTFTPDKSKKYRFLYDATPSTCKIIPEIQSKSGGWSVNQDLYLRDTSNFNFETISPCPDQL